MSLQYSGGEGNGVTVTTPYVSPDEFNAAPGIEGDETGDVVIRRRSV